MELLLEQIQRKNQLLLSKLEQAGWNFMGWEVELARNQPLEPGAMPLYENEQITLGLTYPPQEDYVSVLMAPPDGRRCVEFRFYYQDEACFERFLELIVHQQDQLSFEAYRQLVNALCQMGDVFWEVQGFEQEKVTDATLATDRYVRHILPG